MKKKILLFTLIAGMCYLGFSSYVTGPAFNGFNRSGANSSVTNCGDVPSGCHGGFSASTTASITVDSVGGVAVTKYVAGMTYTVTVTGANSAMTHYGFEFTAVSGSSPSQINAGSFSSFPSLVAMHSTGGLNFVEHTNTISGATLSKSFTWTAPSPAVGAITMYLTVNAVNGDGNANAADVSNNTSITLQHSTSAVASIADNVSIKTFPNPVTNTLNLQLDNAQTGNYSTSVYDLNGKVVASQILEINSAAQVATINTANLIPGMYILSVEKDGSRQVTSFIKQ